jgi:plastocyanin
MILAKTLFRTGWMLLLLLASCSSGTNKVEKADEAATAPSGVHTIEGVVLLAGNAVPTPTRVENSTDPDVCGRIHTLESLVVSTENRGVKDVIVALIDAPPNKIPQSAPDRLILDNNHCRFSPHVSVVTAGSTIEATNSDAVLHTTHLYGAMEANIALPVQGQKVPRTVVAPGMIVVKCDVHGWMQAFIRVDAHPFHAVTGPTGSFRIPNVPNGTYVLETWHETLGQRRTTIHVTDSEAKNVEIEYSLENH